METLDSRFKKEVFDQYISFLRAQYRFHPYFQNAKKVWENKLTSEELINGPYLEKAQIYAEGDAIDLLPLDPKTILTIKNSKNGIRSLWKHQTEALKLILNGKNAVVATGTSSGKTLCYQIPILNDLIIDQSPGLRAIIIYPMNALVNDQLSSWEDLLLTHPSITFARFTGQTPDNQNQYIDRLRASIKQDLLGKQLSEQELYRTIELKVMERLSKDPQNRLNHREIIRQNPPHVLITNFSMLEYLLERPIDAAIFENPKLKFLVLDEVHAYRGVQATEIAFLIRRLKDRLQAKNVISIATSATLGKQGDPKSEEKVRKFVSDLFGTDFLIPNPIEGKLSKPILQEPVVEFTPEEYINAVTLLETDPKVDLINVFRQGHFSNLSELFLHDRNLYRLRTEILTKPKLLRQAAEELWGKIKNVEEGLGALLKLAAQIRIDDPGEDLLPTRLHYFIKAQDGLFICLNVDCPGRINLEPKFFVSRKNGEFDGECPDCANNGVISKLVELVTCRKCGYLFGALQDLGPKRKINIEDTGEDEANIDFDSFTTELGWSSDSFWTYFSIKEELPYPAKLNYEEDGEGFLIDHSECIQWCISCGKKSDRGAGDVCLCPNPRIRDIQIFHRQCSHKGRAVDRKSLGQKKLLQCCPNCGVRNGSGIEPVKRFQESDDEMGIAMAVPLAHFNINSTTDTSKKLLCFTDHRQRAAAFPSLLEEEIFVYDFGRKILEIVDRETQEIDFVMLGNFLADAASENSKYYDKYFFLPISRFPDIDPDEKGKINLWIAEVFGYFGIPDSARESVEDFGLLRIEYKIKQDEKIKIQDIFRKYGIQDDSEKILQVLLSFIRQRKAFTLPPGVTPDAPAFGRVTADIGYVLNYDNVRNTLGWLPKNEKEGKNTYVTSYLNRAFPHLSHTDVRSLAKEIWEFLTSSFLLIPHKWNSFKLSYERLYLKRPKERFVCNKCSLITTYSVNKCCLRKDCLGQLEEKIYDPDKENFISRWLAGLLNPRFTSLRTEEHSAQIDKDLAKIIEDLFRSTGGVNLLSSTTTFEMGINIGDLQKVLLRNAPPSSASYVQRIGRAGRGKDKNAVCVTLCRRTKYDADSWDNPIRLMSGAVRTPTVFISNKIIAQRHFNAVVFARFLRVRVIEEKILGQIGQSIPLEFFLSAKTRDLIPPRLSQARFIKGYLDFNEWFCQTNEQETFSKDFQHDLLKTLDGFDNARYKSTSIYMDLLGKFENELVQLLNERERLYKEGLPLFDVEKAIKGLLSSSSIDVLAKRGFLPRYAFPLDVVTLETGWSRWSRDTDVELSRERGVAIAEFAPGGQVIAHKKVFTSAGLYRVTEKDIPDKIWFSKCANCGQIRTDKAPLKLKQKCEICGTNITDFNITAFVQPNSFSILIDKKKGNIERFGKSTLVRQRQSTTYFIDSVKDKDFNQFGDFQIAIIEGGNLFKYNLGPGGHGFVLCPTCGFSSPFQGFNWESSHDKLRSLNSNTKCSNENVWRTKLAYAHQFQSWCVIIKSNKPWNSVESVAYAIQRGMCKALDVDTYDIGMSWRRQAGVNEPSNPEIVLYDQAPGGSGFVKEALENWEKVLFETKDLVNSCDCKSACYDCLKDYSNQIYHDNLDRFKVINFFKS